MTLWEQSEQSTLKLEPVTIPDRDPITGKTTPRRFLGQIDLPKKRYAVLDGRQRCTAIAMAFGGFRAQHGLYRYSGRYYLDVTEEDPRNRIKFFKENDVKRKGLNVDTACVKRGLRSGSACLNTIRAEISGSAAV